MLNNPTSPFVGVARKSVKTMLYMQAKNFSCFRHLAGSKISNNFSKLDEQRRSTKQPCFHGDDTIRRHGSRATDPQFVGKEVDPAVSSSTEPAYFHPDARGERQRRPRKAHRHGHPLENNSQVLIGHICMYIVQGRARR